MSLERYPHKLTPFNHQRDILERTAFEPAFGLLWEQGTGKTKPIIDTAAVLFAYKKIDAVLVVAPNSVHRNWVSDELPAHLPDFIRPKVRTHIYRPASAKAQWHKSDLQELIKHEGLAWLTMSYDALMTDPGKTFVWKFLQKRRVLYVLDESARIKSPNTKRSIRAVASARHAPYRRILTGTPIANGPFDIYQQMKFLDEDFWRRQGFGGIEAFKAEFGVFKKGYNYSQSQEFESLVGYKNLSKLHEMIKPMTSRVLKEEVLDLPPKLYSKLNFEMSKEQQKAYTELRDEMKTWLDGEKITAALAVTRLLRLQQIASGYLPSMEEDEPHHVFPKNPRLELMKELTDDCPHQAIIWCRFRMDVDLIIDMLGKKAVRFDGKLDEEERDVSKLAFQRGDAQFFVGNPSVGGEGLTLIQAKTEFYYTNSFKLVERLQSEDRAHRIGQDTPVNIIDIMAADSVDSHIVGALRRKLDIASQITGDELKQWI
jgi:SNF2 family DNA or RNA helicase